MCNRTNRTTPQKRNRNPCRKCHSQKSLGRLKQTTRFILEISKTRTERYPNRFIIVPLTGSAAALLQGSIYHPVFGINSESKQITGI